MKFQGHRRVQPACDLLAVDSIRPLHGRESQKRPFTTNPQFTQDHAHMLVLLGTPSLLDFACSNLRIAPFSAAFF